MSNLFAEVEARQDIKINNLTGAETSVDRDIAGRIIDTTWSYSRHWPEQASLVRRSGDASHLISKRLVHEAS